MFDRQSGSLVGSNGRLEVVFDGASGAIASLRNLVTGQALVEGAMSSPWRLIQQGGSFYVPPHAGFTQGGYEPAGFSFSLEDGGERAELSWETSEQGIRVRVSARFAGDALELWPRVEVEATASPPAWLEYPLLAAPRPLAADGGDDYLVFPAQAGWLIRDPLRAPAVAGPGQALTAASAPVAGRSPGFEAVYPDGYHGCSVQFMAYVSADGGFYVACHDPHSTCKLLRFSSAEIAIGHESWDLRRGAALDLDYPVVIAPLVVGDWYEAADRYRIWAIGAPWARGGVPNAHNPDLDGVRWLFEEVGLSIWGSPSSLDWTPWYEFYAEVAGTPLHICAGWDWPASRPHTVGKEGWFPARFHPANLEVWKKHRVTPYMNDLFISARAAGFDEVWEPNLIFPYANFDWTRFSEARVGWVDGEAPGPDRIITTTLDFVVCPATDAQRELHAWRDTELVRAYGLEGVFYDISSGNPYRLARCLRAEHGHPPGRGRAILEAYNNVNRASKEAVADATGRYLVQGVETIVENVGGSVDFYVSRACAGPLGKLEAWALGPERDGRELIPLYQAVYHDIGPVHEDGWMTLAADTGDLFFWVAARIYLQWGGLMSLHYAGTTPPEHVPGCEEGAEAIAFDGARVRFEDLAEPDPEKMAFVRELGRARTTYGRAFLAYGRILRPVPLEVGSVELRYKLDLPQVNLRNEGTWRTSEVVQGAWQDVNGNLGLFFASLQGSRPVAIDFEADPAVLWGLDLSGATVSLVDAGGEKVVGSIGRGESLTASFTLPPRAVALLRTGP